MPGNALCKNGSSLTPATPIVVTVPGILWGLLRHNTGIHIPRNELANQLAGKGTSTDNLHDWFATPFRRHSVGVTPEIVRNPAIASRWGTCRFVHQQRRWQLSPEQSWYRNRFSCLTPWHHNTVALPRMSRFVDCCGYVQNGTLSHNKQHDDAIDLMGLLLWTSICTRCSQRRCSCLCLEWLCWLLWIRTGWYSIAQRTTGRCSWFKGIASDVDLYWMLTTTMQSRCLECLALLIAVDAYRMVPFRTTNKRNAIDSKGLLWTSICTGCSQRQCSCLASHVSLCWLLWIRTGWCPIAQQTTGRCNRFEGIASSIRTGCSQRRCRHLASNALLCFLCIRTGSSPFAQQTIEQCCNWEWGLNLRSYQNSKCNTKTAGNQFQADQNTNTDNIIIRTCTTTQDYIFKEKHEAHFRSWINNMKFKYFRCQGTQVRKCKS